HAGDGPRQRSRRRLRDPPARGGRAMSRVLIVGNSGSGKSTLATRLAEDEGLEHLDLDTLAWLPTTPPTRRPLAESDRKIQAFIAAHTDWVIEGCYADLMTLAAPHATKLVFLNPGI